MSEEASEEAMVCQQTIRVGDDCCTSYDDRCGAPATWQRAEDGVALCDVHLGNARTLGGAKLGYWTVGEKKVQYPDGWTRIEDGAPLIDEPPAPKPSAAVDEKVRPSGLVLP